MATKNDMPEIQEGDWLLTISSRRNCHALVHEGALARQAVAEGARDRITEIRGERNGRPFIWRRKA